MIDFIIIVAVVGTLLCGLLIITIIGLVAFDLFCALRRRRKRDVLPHPDIAAERKYDIQYFYRAIGRTDK